MNISIINSSSFLIFPRPLQLVHSFFGMNICYGILINVFWLSSFFYIFFFIRIFVFIQQWVIEISNCYSISFEEPRLKLLNHRSFKRSNIFIKLYYIISELLYFFHFQLIIPFANFFLFHHFELLFIDNIFSNFLLSFAILFVFQIGLQFINSLFLFLCLLCFYFNLLFFHFQLFYVL